MPTATLNGNQTTLPGLDLGEDSVEASNKRTRRGNALMRRLEPSFLSNPQPLPDLPDGMMSDEFCFEKCSKMIVEPLGFQSEKDLIAFAKQTWQWIQQAEAREKEAIANRVLQEIESDPKLLEIIRGKLSKPAP